MNNEGTQAVLARGRIIVYAVYASLLLYIPIVALRLPDVPLRDNPLISLVLLGGALMSFMVSLVLGELRLDRERLAEKVKGAPDRAAGMKAAATEIVSSITLVSALGDSCAILGLASYFVTGDNSRPWLFFVLTCVHFVLTLRRLRRAEKDLLGLSPGG